MELYVLNTSLDIVDIVDTYKSIIWTTRYYTSGDFELYIPATQKTLDVLKRDYYLIRSDDTTQAMIIQDIQITTDVDEGNYLIVTGKSLKSILGRRIIWTQTVFDGYVEKGIRQLVSANMIDASDSARNISNLTLGAELGLTDTMSAQFTGNNLEEVIQSLCKAYGLGYDVLLDLDAKKFIFILYQGTDRSYNQTTNPYVIFSNDFENLLRSNYTFTASNYRNVAKVAGEGEGINRKTAVVGNATGLNRYELYVDARDISTNNGGIDDDAYGKLLSERGFEKLAETSTKENIDGEVETNYTYKPNEDYFLGDIVEVVNEYGIAMTPRIIEMIESEDDTGRYTIPTFSTSNEE